MPLNLTCQPSPAHDKRVLLVTHHRRSARSTHDADQWFARDMPPPKRDRQLQDLESFRWISELPCAAELSISLCLRGLSCDAVLPRARDEMAPAAMHSCFEEPAGRSNGTESRCAFRFLAENYAAKDWSGVYFAHDDVALNPAHRWPYASMVEVPLLAAAHPCAQSTLQKEPARPLGATPGPPAGAPLPHGWWRRAAAAAHTPLPAHSRRAHRQLSTPSYPLTSHQVCRSAQLPGAERVAAVAGRRRQCGELRLWAREPRGAHARLRLVPRNAVGPARVARP